MEALFQGMDRDQWILIHNHKTALFYALEDTPRAKEWRSLTRHYKKQLQKVEK